MLTIDGLVTGIDTETIVAGLLEIQQRQIDVLQGRSDEVAARQGAFQGIQSQLQTLRSEAGRLARSQNSVFDARVVNISDDDAVIATASSRASVGNYQLRVNQLARAHQVASQGFSDADASITQGTITLQVGDASPVTLTIDSTNDSLAGLAAAINNADAGVSASVIQDGSTSGAPYRLLLTGDHTGASQAISITNQLAADTGDATRPLFDTDNPVQTAADASVTLGDGPGAITVFSETNRVDNLLDGVSLTLRQADAAKSLTISVEADTEPATSAVKSFVEAYNGLVSFVSSLSQFNSESGEGGLLLGNRNVASLLQSVRAAVLDTVPGLNSRSNRLTSLGISLTDDGKLEFNQSKLEEILQGRDPSIHAGDLRRLFSLSGESSHASVRFLTGSSRTTASTDPYQVDITQAAERASVVAATALTGSVTIDDLNNTVRLTIDGADSGDLTLSAGTYTPQDFANHLEAVINAAPSLAGRNVAVSLTGGAIKLTSATYGTQSEVTIGTGSANATLGFAGGEADYGQDVAGTFLVNGQSESATGRGQLLTGNSDNPFTADLQVRVSLTSADVVAGPEADLTVTRGLAARLDQTLNSLLDPVTGRLKTISDGFDETIASLQQSIDRQTAEFTRQRESIVQEFIALETAISELNTTSSFLAAQLAGLSSGRR